MVVTVMQLLDPGSVVSMQMSCASLRTLAAQNSSDFALRNIGLARLAKDYAVVHAASNDGRRQSRIQPPITSRFRRWLPGTAGPEKREEGDGVGGRAR